MATNEMRAVSMWPKDQFKCDEPGCTRDSTHMIWHHNVNMKFWREIKGFDNRPTRGPLMSWGDAFDQAVQGE
jgi:hypothetical protein